MKNHWLELHRKRQKQNIWTAEFSHNAVFCLQPRQVTVQKADFNYGLFGHSNGRLGIVFNGALQNTSDNELLNFLTQASQGGMTGMVSRMKKYSNVMSGDPVSCYELEDLTYDSLGTGWTTNDLKLTFEYKKVKKLPVK